MLDLNSVFKEIYSGLELTMSRLAFTPDKPENYSKGDIPVFSREDSKYLAYSGEKGKIRILFNDNKIRLLAADKDSKSQDDSDYTLIASFLLILEEYEIRDVKSAINEIAENLEDAYTPKQIAKRQQNAIRTQATVSRSAVKSGSLLYDSATLAIRLAALYPELKEEYKNHIIKYDEFLCEDFFVNCVNPKVFATIKENNPQKMKKLFSIINEIYPDGTNEVQDVIVVTMLSSFEYTGDMWKTVLDYLNDTIDEPFIRVNHLLKSSKGASLRLANPPKYKPKAQKKKKSIMGSVLNQQ